MGHWQLIRLLGLFLLLSQSAVAALTLRFDDAAKSFREPFGRAVQDLGATPTGSDLLGRLSDWDVRIESSPSAQTMQYSHKALSVAPDYLASLNENELAYIFAHELEHAYQAKIGISGTGALYLGVSELAALSLQARVWVELDGKTRADPRDLSEARHFVKDMWTWLEFPWTAMTGWCAMNPSMDFKLGSEWPAHVTVYWNSVLEKEQAWRQQWSGRFPVGQDRGAVALLYLKTELDVGLQNRGQKAAGEISAWLPLIIEKLAALRAGQELELPARASEKDLFVLRASPIPFQLRGKGQKQVLVRGDF